MFECGLNYNYDFNQIITLFRYSQTDFEVGSNEESNLRDCITEFELFLMNIGNNEVFTNVGVQLTYKDMFQFLTVSDRIPTYGFEKLIDVEFVKCSFPRVSTCGLNISLTNEPKEIVKMLVTSIVYGGGFGEV